MGKQSAEDDVGVQLGFGTFAEREGVARVAFQSAIGLGMYGKAVSSIKGYLLSGN